MLLPLFLIPMASGLIAQAIKPFFNKRWYAEIDAAGHRIPRYGGMPSAHVSFAVGLVTVVGMQDGFSSASFAVAAAILIIVLDDALRMRMFLGRYGAALRQLIARLPKEARHEFPYIESRLGHRTSEVLAGALVGFAVSALLTWIVL